MDSTVARVIPLDILMKQGHTSIRVSKEAMKRHIAFALAVHAYALTAAPQPTFEIADVHVGAKTLHPVRQGGALRGGRYELAMATMVDLIAAAYGVPGARVVGGPAWLEMDRFDVVAKAPQDTSPQALGLMLQALLAERFHLTVHTDQRPMPAFALTVANGNPKMRESDGSGPTGCQRQPQAAEAGAIPATCHGITMPAFVGLLSAAAGDYLSSPVVDQTKLEGGWDFTLKWTPRGGLSAAGADGITIFDALNKQLGLKLEQAQIPMPVIVIDVVDEKPSANPPGVSASLPPAPRAQFEAATIKPTNPAFNGTNIQLTPGVNIQGVSLSFLMQNIWFVTPELIAGAPKWLDTEHWDIVGKIAATPGSAPRMDLDSMIVMVRDLIEDRFRLKTHVEERVAPAWTLTALKPKLRKADPENRTGCKEGPGEDGKDPRLANPAISRLVTCHNMTMAQFAEQLPNLANAQSAMAFAYLRSPVVDSTGLEGAYDFTLGFSLPSAVQSKGDAGSGLADPNGVVSLFDAVSGQLGLKLSLEKRPASVLVIDHVEQKPVEN